MIAIIALLLPGVSGSFILVILGKYNLIIASLKNPLLWDNAVVLLFFYAGMIAGLLCFVHGIYWVMKKWEKFVLAFLGGLTFGSLRKIWPWKEMIVQEKNLVGGLFDRKKYSTTTRYNITLYCFFYYIRYSRCFFDFTTS